MVFNDEGVGRCMAVFLTVLIADHPTANLTMLLIQTWFKLRPILDELIWTADDSVPFLLLKSSSLFYQ